MKLLSIHLLVAACLGVGAVAEPQPIPDIEFPTSPVPKPPKVVPADDVIRLTEDIQYVFDSNDPVIVLASPRGVLLVTEDPGPVRFRGVFFGGGGQVESRLFKRKQVFGVTGVVEGSAELLIVPTGVKSENQVIRKSFVVGRPAPKVDPNPKVDPPKVDPNPKVDPSPFTEPGLRVLMVYERSELTGYKPGQKDVLGSQKFRDHLNAVCVQGSDGRPAWRVWEQDVPNLQNEAKVWQDAMKLKRDKLPWIVIGNGTTGTAVELPDSVPAAIALVDKYKGG